MFSTFSRVEKAVSFGFTDGVQEPRCEVIEILFCLVLIISYLNLPVIVTCNSFNNLVKHFKWEF